MYLIRWLSAYHETGDPAKHRRGGFAGNLIATAPLWRTGQEHGPRHPTTNGDYLVIVVEPEDTVGFLFGQLVEGEPAMLYPTRFNQGIGALTIRLGPNGLSGGSADGGSGSVGRDEVPADASFVELCHCFRSKETGAQSIPAEIRRSGGVDVTGVDYDVHVADAVSKPTS